jgi:hypothetical protein
VLKDTILSNFPVVLCKNKKANSFIIYTFYFHSMRNICFNDILSPNTPKQTNKKIKFFGKKKTNLELLYAELFFRHCSAVYFFFSTYTYTPVFTQNLQKSHLHNTLCGVECMFFSKKKNKEVKIN